MWADSVFNYLKIPDRRERWLVGSLDLALKPIAGIRRIREIPRQNVPPSRILLLRLERIGDMLMTVQAIQSIRRRAPEAHLRLVVGSWNANLAEMVSEVDRVDTVDAPWLSREGTCSSLRDIAQTTLGWSREKFDLGINFEPDIRTNGLLATSGATRRVGWTTGGGGAFLTDALHYDSNSHVTLNAQRLVDHALPAESASSIAAKQKPLTLPASAKSFSALHLAEHARTGPLVGINPGCGRSIKQWPTERFAQLAASVSRLEKATIVLLGAEHERPLTEAIKRSMPAGANVVDMVGTSLIELSGVLQRISVLVTGDTGPMHLAAAVGTPTVALFGPSDPKRYAPLHRNTRVIHTNLWCRPCGLIRRPPARCQNRTPDCIEGITVERVLEETRILLNGQP